MMGFSFKNIKAEDKELLQNLITTLGINQKIEVKFITSFNFQIENKNECKIINFDTYNQKYIFLQAGSQLQYQQQPGDVIYNNNQLFSIVCILEYFYFKIMFEKSIQKKSDFINLCNQFMIALGQSRVYNNNTKVKWSSWNTYWSSPSYISTCYSNCSGVCNQETCAGSQQCIYYFHSNEINNPNLPEKERKDPNNRFDDKLYFLASLFDLFVREEASQFENFFFSYQKTKSLGGEEKTLDIIQVQILNDNVIQLKSLSELYEIDKNQIKSLSILSLEDNLIPKDEAQRKLLYEFILSLQNLNSLEIQLEKGIYHSNEENFQPSNNCIKYFIPVPNDVVNNFTKFLSQLKVEKLSLMLDEFCYLAAIGLGPIFDCLPKINQKLKTLQISINHRRMHEAKYILQSLCQIKQLEVLNLKIKKQWANYHCSISEIQEDFQQWETQLKQQLKNLKNLKID